MTVDVLEPAAPEETARPVGEAPADQAVFDAEFVAMMLTEAPWAEARPGPDAVPPHRATGSPPSPPPRPPASRRPRTARPRTPAEMQRETRRRTCSGPRSPPR